jgi:5-methylcytosine-specific restriction endonuclease McrA
MRHTLAIDFGSKYIGVALVRHPQKHHNQVLYAAIVTVKPNPLNDLVKTRVQVRRIRRTRKTHRRRLRQLAHALTGIPAAAEIVRFCRRRGFSHDDPQEEETTHFQVHRTRFFEALRKEIERLVAPEHRDKVYALCARHLNLERRRAAELRPARFENRRATVCHWIGCGKNVRKAENAIADRLRQALFAWMLPVFKESAAPDKLKQSLNYWSERLAGLAKRYAQASDDAGKKAVNKEIRAVYQQLRNRVKSEAKLETAEAFAGNWNDYYRSNVNDLLKRTQGGRVRFCRLHSKAYVDHLLAEKKMPLREDIEEKDLISRKQQIVFRRLWRLVEGRMLALAGGRIDRVICERVAFDVLAGSWKDRQKVTPEKAAEMYWSGPQFRFATRLDMLKKEYGNRCAYCGEVGRVSQVEHLLPSSAFPFDSYFNTLPACAACNNKKGARTALEANMPVHGEAYKAYVDYVRKLKTPHVYHLIKKGLLNLLQQPNQADKAERRLGMLANDLVRITATQQSPRPLARYLATKLAKRTRLRPKIEYRAGRHTALYRSILMPDFQKDEHRDTRDLRHHAIDAIILACDLPSATELENDNWNQGAQVIDRWFHNAKKACPELLLGYPKIEAVKPIPNFEDDLGGGYFEIQLAAFNWNRKRKATHVLDPFGITPNGRPLKRIPAANVLDDLKDAKTRDNRIEDIAHRGLRMALQKTPEEAAKRFLIWLQESVQAGLKKGCMGQHPADLARQQLLKAFVDAPLEKLLAGAEAIPLIIGIKCIHRGSQNKIDVTRCDASGAVFQRYQADPVIRELIVGYKERNGSADRSKPIQFFVTQAHALKWKQGGERVCVTDDPSSPLHGRAQGSAESQRDFLQRWQAACDHFFREQGIVKQFSIRQGCVIEKTDGSRMLFRNFDTGGPWMRKASFRDIRRVYRSPFQAIRQSNETK